MSSLLLPGNATPSQVLTGQKFSAGSNFNVGGTMPNNGAVTITPSTANQAIAAGYHNGSGVVNGDTNLVAANILNGKSIFGVAGNVTARQYASGTATSSSSTVNFTAGTNTYGGTQTVSTFYYLNVGTGFQPTTVLIYQNTSTVMTVYNTTWTLGLDGSFRILYTNVAGFSQSTDQSYVFKLDGTSAFTNANGFQLPVPSSSASYYWIAYN